MNSKEARKIAYSFWQKDHPSEDEIFAFTEAMNFLIETEQNPRDMMELGGYYYETRHFDLALKYYEMASTFDYESADECLGYIWYYGRTGEKDYKKAFEHFSKAMERGNIVAAYKIADMYKNGYYVEKDYNKYCEIIEKQYKKIRKTDNLFAPLPEIFTRLADIKAKQGRKSMAIKLYKQAKEFLAQRISYSNFFGNLNIMNWLVNDLYKLEPLSYNDEFDLFDLYYLLKNNYLTISFKYGSKKYLIESICENDEMAFKFEDKYYRNIEDLLSKACVDDKALTTINNALYDFKVESIEVGKNIII